MVDDERGERQEHALLGRRAQAGADGERPGGPTGIAVYEGSGFRVSAGGVSDPARFIYACEDGKIRAWTPTVPHKWSAQSEVAVDDGGEAAIFRGVAVARDRLYATDFHNARVDVFDANWRRLRLPGSFTDSTIPSWYAPDNIQLLGGRLFVTYVGRAPVNGNDDPTGGYVDEFDLAGRLVARVGRMGVLNEPWGLALAPPSFGRYRGDLLVANFGDGHVNAFRESGGRWTVDGALAAPDGRPLVLNGVWGIAFGNGGAAGAKDTLFFSSGPTPGAGPRRCPCTGCSAPSRLRDRALSLTAQQSSRTDDPLRANIRLLGDLLGRVIVEQEGEELLELEERIRLLARAGRSGDAEAAPSCAASSARSTSSEQALVLRAFALYFQLANIAEQHHRLRRRRAVRARGTRRRASRSPTRSRSSSGGRRREELRDAAAGSRSSSSSPRIRPRRRAATVLRAHRRIAALLRELDDPELPRSAQARGRTRPRRGDHAPLADRRGALAAPAGRRRDPPRALVRRGEPVGGRAAAARRAARAAARRRGASPLRFGTWIGGDLDGNPHAGAETVEAALEQARALALALLAATCASSRARGGSRPSSSRSTPRSAPSTTCRPRRTPTSRTGGG